MSEHGHILWDQEKLFIKSLWRNRHESTLVPDFTKPLSEPMLTYHQGVYSTYQSVRGVKNCTFKITSTSPRVQLVKNVLVQPGALNIQSAGIYMINRSLTAVLVCSRSGLERLKHNIWRNHVYKLVAMSQTWSHPTRCYCSAPALASYGMFVWVLALP